ncbi:unnamed protein product [Brassicogethes aeneus]|uniref:Uncharacterized protein n=1 Tax=Brassicogethes aeneus TaxID=1431903 RepID=A0A9P0BBH8_BRAAE|nr:unnamed protein product [Brassicogethes aeneus]
MTLYYVREENPVVMDLEPECIKDKANRTICEVDAREFYRTYDVMTGVRIAYTLGGFFGLMVVLVLYKSKSKTEKALEDPDFTAAAVAEVEEEERQLQAVLEQTAYEELNPRRSRRSLDTSSMPPGWIRNSKRFSSVGGYSSLLEPPTRMSSRLPSFIDEDSPPEDDKSFYDEVSFNYNSHLNVPRRSSNITCSSSGSSYLERRDSAVALGLPALPAHKSKYSRRQSSPVPEIYDFYYPIDIRVTQPTPGGSPCGSDRALYDRVGDPPNLKPKLAPLASISSCNTSIGIDLPEFDIQSLNSDSVFNNNDEDGDTDHEIDEFSTDSDEGACYSRDKKSHLPHVGCNVTQRSSSKSSLTVVEQEVSGIRLKTLYSEEEKTMWPKETLF